MRIAVINLELLIECHSHARLANIPYKWGEKPRPDADSATITGSDCSGYSRWLIARGTEQATLLPLGTDSQYTTLQNATWEGNPFNYKPSEDGHPYPRGTDLHPQELFLTIALASVKHPGHTWMTYGGRTIECCGGRGVCSQPTSIYDAMQWNQCRTWRLPTK